MLGFLSFLRFVKNLKFKKEISDKFIKIKFFFILILINLLQ